jgi:N-ethylmaleimide reductase
VRLSPFGRAGGSHDSDPAALYAHVIASISRRRNAYLHLIEARASGVGRSDQLPETAIGVAPLFRPLYDGVLISSGGYSHASAEAALLAGHADAIGFGRMFIANPDLPARLLRGAPLQPYQRATFYGGGAVGYTDYPALYPPPPEREQP